MTREAKIGMLTGLGVIVLIGVLLSEYLGDKTGPGGTAPTKMAQLPVGQQYRQQVMEPVAVPSLTRSEMPMAQAPVIAPAAPKASNTNLNNVMTDLTANLAPGMGTMAQVPAAYAAEPRMEQAVVPAVAVGPRMAAPVSMQPLSGGQPEMPVLAGGAPPTITLEPMMRAETPVVALAKAPAAEAPKANGVVYTIQAGDNLAKISKKFYGQAKQSDLQKIVAVNPGSLKDATTMLVVGKKLTIPVPTPVPAAPVIAKDPAKVAVAAKKPEPSMVYLPGAEVKAPVKEKVTAPVKKESPKTYTVQSGDTLEKIAKKLSPANAKQMQDRLRQANGLKASPELKIGQTLKLPV